jgi:hypothetical protein
MGIDDPKAVAGDPEDRDQCDISCLGFRPCAVAEAEHRLID